ncbi:MAG TPA: hypothetical protein VNO86_03000 [Candidatus Binatia bacterium]|nr:hypothetical protein [Candidatus Binatia bacterium]
MHETSQEENDYRAEPPTRTGRLDRETTEIEAAIMLVASGRAVSVTATDLPEAAVLVERLETWARELGVELVRLTVAEGPEAILVRRHR